MIINRILREITTPMAFLHRTSNAKVHRGTDKSTILGMIPPGHDRFILQWNGGEGTHEGSFGHSVCIRRNEKEDTWYLLDSLYREKALQPKDWEQLYGMTYVLASGDAWDYREGLQSIAGEQLRNSTNQAPSRSSQANVIHPDEVQVRALLPAQTPPQAPAAISNNANLTKRIAPKTRIIPTDTQATPGHQSHANTAQHQTKRRHKQCRTSAETHAAQELKKLLATRNPNTRPHSHSNTPPSKTANTTHIQNHDITSGHNASRMEACSQPNPVHPHDLLDGTPHDELLNTIRKASSLLGKLMDKGMLENMAPLPADNSWYEINRLANMYFPHKDPLLQQWNDASQSTLLALKFITGNRLFLKSLHKHTSSRFSQNKDNAPPITCNPTDSTIFITWNVRGIHSKAQVLSELAARYKPLAVALTETKLLPHQHATARVRNYLPGYTMIASCHPRPSDLIKCPRYPNPDGSTRNHTTGKAGVILAIKSEWARSHYLHRFETPQSLLGHMVHIRLSLPDSTPLHLIAIYRANSNDWKHKHQELNKYLKTAIDQITLKEEQLLMGGDWNGVLHNADRSSGNINLIDETLQQTFTALHLCSAFITQPNRPHTYHAPHLNSQQPTSSRIDDWTCIRDSTLATKVSQRPQTQIIDESWIKGISDHHPVRLTIPTQALFLCPPTEPPPQIPRRPTLERHSNPLTS